MGRRRQNLGHTEEASKKMRSDINLQSSQAEGQLLVGPRSLERNIAHSLMLLCVLVIIGRIWIDE